MTLIKSISGIRGTIGGESEKNLTPIDIVKLSASYGLWIKNQKINNNNFIIIGRDARISGDTINKLVIATLQNIGINIIDIGISTVSTVGISITIENAIGGIMLSASHNPKNWNAIKFLDNNGELISENILHNILKIFKKNIFYFINEEKIGFYKKKYNYISKHIKKILKLPLVDIESIKNSKFTIVVDGINSTGGIAVPMLLNSLGVNVIKIHCNANGKFVHDPEPLPKNLYNISKKVLSVKADFGIAIDPDVDRLVFICENGEFFGEEYSLVAIADYVLKYNIGPTVSNLSSSLALRDITNARGALHYYCPVGELNVIKKMKEVNAVIGGEGNGGIIYPKLHYGRDALVGIALFLSYLSNIKISISTLRAKYPNYFISKKKIKLPYNTFFKKKIFSSLREEYKNMNIDITDGIRINFEKEWVHLRVSNTESVIRIYAESISQYNADKLTSFFLKKIKKY